MGFNFQAGTPKDVFEQDHADRVTRELQTHLGIDVPLGEGIPIFCLNDELGWSWWSELQAFASDQLGSKHSRQINALDAWQAVYIDSDVDRIVVWPDEPPKNKPGVVTVAASGPQAPRSFLTGLSRLLGFHRKQHVPAEISNAAMGMLNAYGPDVDERGGLQVGNLRLLMNELEALLRLIPVIPEESEVEQCMRSYSEDDNRIDDDPAIQCLCHAWLTARYALRNGVPLWLIK